MNVRIHRGACQVGGSCVEIEHDGARIVLDVGMPLDPVEMRDLLPDVPGLWASGDGSLLAVLLSHVHLDHCGLADLVDPAVPIYTSAPAHAILGEAAFFMPWRPAWRADGWLEHGRALHVGPFTVTPLAVDHSAHDSFALLVEAGGRRLLYSGDLRAHGHGPALPDALQGAGAVDVLLLEGTRIAAPGDGPPSEADLEDRVAALLHETRGLALAAWSAQDVGRLATLRQAARRASRELVVDLYTACVARAAGAPLDGLRVYLPSDQRSRVIESGDFDRVNRVRPLRIFRDEIVERPADLVVAARRSVLRELDRADCLDGGHAIWSMWPGYLERDGNPLADLCVMRGLALEVAHASGHARREDLEALVDALAPDRVVPIHTRAPHEFAALFGQRAELRADGEWFAV